MLEIFKAIWFFFVPARVQPLDIVDVGDDTDRLQKINGIFDTIYWWRVKVAASLFGLIIFALWGVSSWGFVQAADFSKKAEETIKQLKDDVQATKVEVAQIKTSNQAIATAVNELVAEKVATNICQDIARLKAEPDFRERAIQRAEIDALQRRYRLLANEYYPEDRCR